MLKASRVPLATSVVFIFIKAVWKRRKRVTKKPLRSWLRPTTRLAREFITNIWATPVWKKMTWNRPLIFTRKPRSSWHWRSRMNEKSSNWKVKSSPSKNIPPIWRRMNLPCWPKWSPSHQQDKRPRSSPNCRIWKSSIFSGNGWTRWRKPFKKPSPCWKTWRTKPRPESVTPTLPGFICKWPVKGKRKRWMRPRPISKKLWRWWVILTSVETRICWEAWEIFISTKTSSIRPGNTMRNHWKPCRNWVTGWGKPEVMPTWVMSEVYRKTGTAPKNSISNHWSWWKNRRTGLEQPSNVNRWEIFL